MILDRFDGVSGAGRIMPAMTGHERADGVLVNPDREEQKFTHQLLPFWLGVVGSAGKLI